jgi:hypothetical protein
MTKTRLWELVPSPDSPISDDASEDQLPEPVVLTPGQLAALAETDSVDTSGIGQSRH